MRIINEEDIKNFLDVYLLFQEITNKKMNVTKGEVIQLFEIWLNQNQKK